MAGAVALAGALTLGFSLGGGGGTTKEAAAATGDVIVAAVGDIACDPADAHFNGGLGTSERCRHQYTSDLLRDPAVFPSLAAVLILGDVQYENAAYAKFLQSYDPAWGAGGGLKSITRPAPGNHEYQTAGASGYFDYFGPSAGERGKGYYSFDVGAWHVVALNSNCSQVGGCGRNSRQVRWLRSDLAASATRCTLAYWHHPRFSSSSYGSNTDTKAFWQALYDRGADVVLVGHAHHYERFAPQDASGRRDEARGLREFVVGTGGKSLYSFTSVQPNSEVRHSGTYGVLKLTLGATSYEWQFVPEAGKTFADSGSAACH